MVYLEPQSINSVAKRLKLSVHQLRRWELLFGLEVKRGKGQQRQYRPQDMRLLERIKELVDQGWPASQISHQLEIEGLLTPRLIGLPAPSQNPEALVESVIGVRSFCERRLEEIGQQLSEIRQILISLSLKQQVADATYSPWQPVVSSLPALVKETPPPPPAPVPEEVHELPSAEKQADNVVSIGPVGSAMPEITDQNYLTVLGKTLDLVGWSDEQADEYSLKNYAVLVWLDLGRSDAEKFIEYLRTISDTGADNTVELNAPGNIAAVAQIPSVAAGNTRIGEVVPLGVSPISASSLGGA